MNKLHQKPDTKSHYAPIKWLLKEKIHKGASLEDLVKKQRAKRGINRAVA